MDPITHFMTGANLGRSGFNRKTAYATLAMTLAAEAPDIDIFWGFRGPLVGFEHHRGITHTLIAAPVLALVTTAVVWLIHKARRKPLKPGLPPPRWGLIWLFALIADLSHLLLDYTNNYGIRPFFPFNPRWYARSIVFIIDPLIFLALLGAIGARTGGANVLRATARVTFWGALAMALTAGIGKLFGTVV